jgi:hypothetical protein
MAISFTSSLIVVFGVVALVYAIDANNKPAGTVVITSGSGSSTQFGNITTTGITTNGNQTTTGNENVGENIAVTGNAVIAGVLTVPNIMSTNGTTNFIENVNITDNLNVPNISSTSGTTLITGNLTIDGSLSTETISSTSGTITLSNPVDATSTLLVQGTSNLEGLINASLGITFPNGGNTNFGYYNTATVTPTVVNLNVTSNPLSLTFVRVGNLVNMSFTTVSGTSTNVGNNPIQFTNGSSQNPIPTAFLPSTDQNAMLFGTSPAGTFVTIYGIIPAEAATPISIYSSYQQGFTTGISVALNAGSVSWYI